MTYGVQLLDMEGQAVSSPRDLIAVATPFMRQILGYDLPGVQLFLQLVVVAGYDNDVPGTPYLCYRSEGVGFTIVILVQGDRVVYRHPHSIGEVVELGLRSWLDEAGAPREAAGYRLVGPDIPAYVRDAPLVAGVTEVEPYQPGEEPAFRIRPLPPPPPEMVSLADFGAEPLFLDSVPPHHTNLVKVVVDPRLREGFESGVPFSREVEEGGFLIGQVYEDRDQAGTYITHVKAALSARQTGASLLHFTFTGDSFEHFKRSLEREYPGQRILGWYHTHLFAATPNFGLSSIDYRLHFNTFRLPWQVAGLVNLDERRRVLRFYVRDNDTMAQCSHQPANNEPPQ